MADLTDELLVEVVDQTARIAFNRPEKGNALTLAILDAFPTVLRRLGEDPKIRCVVLTGRGAKFCAGADLQGMNAETGKVENRLERLRSMHEIPRLLHELPKPTIAVLNGSAAGAGLALAMACDFRIAAESAVFTTAFARIGLSGDFGGSWLLQQLVGPAKARELYFTADKIDAREAERIGLINRVVPDQDLEEEASALAEKLAAGPTIAIASMKRTLNLGMDSDFQAALDAEAAAQVGCRDTQDCVEGIRSILEKRPPKFLGR